MTTRIGDSGSAAQASALLDAVVRSESGIDAEVPLRCAIAMSLLRTAGAPAVAPAPLADTPAAVRAALTEAIAHLTAQPDAGPVRQAGGGGPASRWPPASAT